ncbi:nuclear transport factor 2 family protein [Ruegeria sp. 2205SS24-7]|uniref:SnoaL-like domain-containing protein n=1 Tax=Ruegeria discodermiae TaxID=3064389 RepID=UPI0027415124|nr:SnoaL-like domain-containing protein [Ruegeria sp. 2205SS24-7]MDP5215755.1 nuclear transport factor 2 family protein [Ruegeria sp. 2205SS24-7]
MTLQEIAEELVSGCRRNSCESNLETLYAPGAVSVDAADAWGFGRTLRGLDAIRSKHEWRARATEVAAGSVMGPFLHGDDRFAVVYEARGKRKDTGESFDRREVAIYHVAEGKIVREEFFC